MDAILNAMKELGIQNPNFLAFGKRNQRLLSIVIANKLSLLQKPLSTSMLLISRKSEKSSTSDYEYMPMMRHVLKWSVLFKLINYPITGATL